MKVLRSWLWQPRGDLPSFADSYDERYVHALLRGMDRWVTPPWKLELWVDEHWYEKLFGSDERLNVVKFTGAGCGGWSHMMEIYDPGHWPEAPDKRVVAMGLDTILVGPCDWLWEWNEAPCGFIRDPLVPSTISNSVMTFNQEGASHLWKAFLVSLQDGFEGCKIFDLPSEMMLMRRYWELFDGNLAKPYPCLEEHPRRILSFKAHTKNGSIYTMESGHEPSIVYFHGSPKPHELDESLPLRQLWEPPTTPSSGPLPSST
jgi:hypothetical protein